MNRHCVEDKQSKHDGNNAEIEGKKHHSRRQEQWRKTGKIYAEEAPPLEDE